MHLETVCRYAAGETFNAHTLVGETGDRAGIIASAGALMGASHTVYLNQVHGNVVIEADRETPAGLDGDAVIYSHSENFKPMSSPNGFNTSAKGDTLSVMAVRFRTDAIR